MFRFVVLLFCIVWASLLLLSWSSADPPAAHLRQESPAPVAKAR